MIDQRALDAIKRMSYDVLYELTCGLILSENATTKDVIAALFTETDERRQSRDEQEQERRAENEQSLRGWFDHGVRMASESNETDVETAHKAVSDEYCHTDLPLLPGDYTGKESHAAFVRGWNSVKSEPIRSDTEWCAFPYPQNMTYRRDHVAISESGYSRDRYRDGGRVVVDGEHEYKANAPAPVAPAIQPAVPEKPTWTPDQKYFLKMLLNKNVQEADRTEKGFRFAKGGKYHPIESEVAQPLLDAGLLMELPNRWNPEHSVIIIDPQRRDEVKAILGRTPTRTGGAQ